MDQQQKRCSKCGIEKDLSCFNKDRSSKTGYDHYCRDCKKIYRNNHKEEINEKSKQQYKLDRDKYCEKSKRYNNSHKEEISEKQKIYRENNKVKIQQYREAHKAEIAEKSRLYYEVNKEKINERNRHYFKTERGKVARKNSKNKRRVIKKQTDITIDWLVLLRENTKACSYCGVSLDNISIHLEHIQPLSRGGTHTKDNVCFVCKECNLKKHNKTLEEYIEYNEVMNEIFAN